MQRAFLLIVFLFASPATDAQIQRAFLSENFTIVVEETLETSISPIFRGQSFPQMSGFPKRARANNVFKNFRNVTLVDLDSNGAHDILWGADNRLFAYSYDSLLWQRTLLGVVLYPATVANLDEDEAWEIVQPTGGTQAGNRIYLLDEKGADLPGWPLNFNGHWIITAPAASDVDEDGRLEIIFNERDPPMGRIHLVKPDGSTYSSDWPVSIPGTPAVTPSIGDVDGDGEKEIYVTSTTTRYLFDLNGETEPGWPQETGPQQRYSFQSPLLVDLDQDGRLEIIGATHGDLPEYYALQADGSPFPGWPKSVPGNVWTFNTPTVVSIDGRLRLFMSRPIGEAFDEMLYGWDAGGSLLPGFPLFNFGGLEGLISVVDVDGDNEYELLFGSNMLLADGHSYIHAYELNGSTEVPGFPIRVQGWTFMNGVNAGDVNGDGLLDLVALSYTQNFDENLVDSAYLNVFELNVPYSPERVLWSTYKGSNTRDGLLQSEQVTSVEGAARQPDAGPVLFPNPLNEILRLNFSAVKLTDLEILLYNAQGQILETLFAGQVSSGEHEWEHPVNRLPAGMYYLKVRSDRQLIQTMKFIKL